MAREVTTFVHGEAATKHAEEISQLLFKGDIKDLTTEDIEQAFKSAPSVNISADVVNIVDWLVNTDIEPSKRQAREDVKNGAITINGEKVTDIEAEINPADHFDGKYVVVRRGKKHYTLAKVTK
ncbi:tyrosyl-tRNA synthetase [Limosilactobacillus coleohominis DSM 14060]|nr:tyrosyl-tRNA synthetase [Limosilactobacillus coleohominis DSM 14060]